MNKSLEELEELKIKWLDSKQTFELLAPGFEEYWEGLERFKEIHSASNQSSKFLSAIAISYFPTPENSVLAGKTVQSALDETITSMAEIKAAMNLVLANNKPPTFYDALNDLNNKSLDAHTPNTPFNGGVWVENVGDWSIISNQAKASGISGSMATYDCGFGNRGSFEADVTIANVNTPQGIIFRFASNTSYWRAVYSSGKWVLQEIQNATISVRASTQVTGIVFGQTYKFKVLLDESNISFLVNEQLACSWTAITNLTATKFGVYASSSTGTLFKNTKAVNLN
ncbi:hypothetical protein, partial [Chroococcidiopsis sp.]|uniref:hypothetical protein n=1 Tax=Chroococcidiopsis sp. TaxID=3088168 RepID=UPI003F357978